MLRRSAGALLVLVALCLLAPPPSFADFVVTHNQLVIEGRVASIAPEAVVVSTSAEAVAVPTASAAFMVGGFPVPAGSLAVGNPVTVSIPAASAPLVLPPDAVMVPPASFDGFLEGDAMYVTPVVAVTTEGRVSADSAEAGFVEPPAGFVGPAQPYNEGPLAEAAPPVAYAPEPAEYAPPYADSYYDYASPDYAYPPYGPYAYSPAYAYPAYGFGPTASAFIGTGNFALSYTSGPEMAFGVAPTFVPVGYAPTFFPATYAPASGFSAVLGLGDFTLGYSSFGVAPAFGAYPFFGGAYPYPMFGAYPYPGFYPGYVPTTSAFLQFGDFGLGYTSMAPFETFGGAAILPTTYVQSPAAFTSAPFMTPATTSFGRGMGGSRFHHPWRSIGAASSSMTGGRNFARSASGFRTSSASAMQGGARRWSASSAAPLHRSVSSSGFHSQRSWSAPSQSHSFAWNAARPTWHTPSQSYARPAYARPSYARPSYARPSYARPSYACPSYASPRMNAAPPMSFACPSYASPRMNAAPPRQFSAPRTMSAPGRPSGGPNRPNGR